MADRLNSHINQLVAGGRFPGVGAVIIDKSGKELYSHTAGTINANDPSAKDFTPNTQLLIWSLTKLVTSIAILQLLERGLISSLDDPVSKYLPDEANVRVITGFDDEGHPVTRVPKGQVKLIHLLTHISGHVYDVWSPLMYQYRINTGSAAEVGAASTFFDVFLEADPGEKYNYGISTDKLGFVVEKLSNMTLPEYVKENITDPLGMYDTASQPKTDEWLRTHIRDPSGKLMAVEAIKMPDNPDYFGGGYYLISTLNDYSQLLLTLLNDGLSPRTKNRILSPVTVTDYLFRDFIPDIGCSPDGIGVISKSLKTGVSNPGELLPGAKKGWSCGLMLNLEDTDGGRKAGSGGWAGLSNQYYWVDRTSGIAGVFGTGLFPFMDKESLDLFDKVEKFAYSTKHN